MWSLLEAGFLLTPQRELRGTNPFPGQSNQETGSQSIVDSVEWVQPWPWCGGGYILRDKGLLSGEGGL